MPKYLIELDAPEKKQELNELLTALENYYKVKALGAVVVETSLANLDGILRSLAIHVLDDAPAQAPGSSSSGKKKSGAGKLKNCKSCGAEHSRRSKYCSTECYRKDLPSNNGRYGSGVKSGKLVGG